MNFNLDQVTFHHLNQVSPTHGPWVSYDCGQLECSPTRSYALLYDLYTLSLLYVLYTFSLLYVLYAAQDNSSSLNPTQASQKDGHS